MTASRNLRFIRSIAYIQLRTVVCLAALAGLQVVSGRCTTATAQANETANVTTIKEKKGALEDIRLQERALYALNEVMIHDITSPPVASRDYAYTIIAFYEAARPGDPSFRSFAGRLNGLAGFSDSVPGLPKPEAGQAYDWTVAGMTAFNKTALGLLFSKDMFRQNWDSIDLDLRARAISRETYARSVAFGEQMGAAILKWAKSDGYLYTRTLPRYTPSKDQGFWQQTAPDYMEAVEPYWNKIRPMVLERPDQFLLPPPAPITSTKFTEEVHEVNTVGQNLTKEQTAIADFWDCNPFATQTIGHLMFSVKKISPGGHWIGITGVAIRQKQQSLVESLHSYSLVSIAVFDAFIACWDEKYRSNYIRPITAVQQSISKTWEPHLQTPPFPEYPSGHSVVSTAASEVLTQLYGDGFNYVDYTEKPYGLPERSYHSFRDAAAEAAISRLYGGIHFREAIDNGKVMGTAVGKYVMARLN